MACIRWVGGWERERRERGKEKDAAAGENGSTLPLARTAYAGLLEPGSGQDMKGSSPTFSGQYPSMEQGHWTTGCLGLLFPCLP